MVLLYLKRDLSMFKWKDSVSRECGIYRGEETCHAVRSSGESRRGWDPGPRADLRVGSTAEGREDSAGGAAREGGAAANS